MKLVAPLAAACIVVGLSSTCTHQSASVSLSDLPNILVIGSGGEYSYGSGSATDGPPKCAVLREENLGSLRQVGYLGPVSSDITASLAHVISSGDVPVYAGTSTVTNATEYVVKTNDTCWVVYTEMP